MNWGALGQTLSAVPAGVASYQRAQQERQLNEFRIKQAQQADEDRTLGRRVEEIQGGSFLPPNMAALAPQGPQGPMAPMPEQMAPGQASVPMQPPGAQMPPGVPSPMPPGAGGPQQQGAPAGMPQPMPGAPPGPVPPGPGAQAPQVAPPAAGPRPGMPPGPGGQPGMATLEGMAQQIVARNPTVDFQSPQGRVLLLRAISANQQLLAPQQRLELQQHIAETKFAMQQSQLDAKLKDMEHKAQLGEARLTVQRDAAEMRMAIAQMQQGAMNDRQAAHIQDLQGRLDRVLLTRERGQDLTHQDREAAEIGRGARSADTLDTRRRGQDLGHEDRQGRLDVTRRGQDLGHEDRQASEAGKGARADQREAGRAGTRDLGSIRSEHRDTNAKISDIIRENGGMVPEPGSKMRPQYDALKVRRDALSDKIITMQKNPAPPVRDATRQAEPAGGAPAPGAAPAGIPPGAPTATGPNGEKIYWNGTAWLPGGAGNDTLGTSPGRVTVTPEMSERMSPQPILPSGGGTEDRGVDPLKLREMPEDYDKLEQGKKMNAISQTGAAGGAAADTLGVRTDYPAGRRAPLKTRKQNAALAGARG